MPAFVRAGLAGLFALAAGLTSAGPAAAQLPGLPKGFFGSATPTPTPVPETLPDAPRSAVAEYLSLARMGRYEEAARFLDVPASLEKRGPELARKLKLVLDRNLWIDLTKVSPLPGGHDDDGLPPELEELGSITGLTGKPEPVRLARKVRGEGTIWVFSRSTVARVPAWYTGLDNHTVLDRIPAALLRPGPMELLWWQWIVVLPVTLVER